MKSFEIEMKRTGSLFYIKVYFWSLEEQQYKFSWLAVDTGAAVTSISKDIIKRLGYDISNAPTEKVMTASSFEDARKIVLKKLKFGNFELKNVQVHALDFPENNFFTGVLGLNVLTQFDINFIFSKKILKCTPIDEKEVEFT